MLHLYSSLISKALDNGDLTTALVDYDESKSMNVEISEDVENKYNLKFDRVQHAFEGEPNLIMSSQRTVRRDRSYTYTRPQSNSKLKYPNENMLNVN